MCSLERQLDSKSCEVTEQLGHVTELEEELEIRTSQLSKLRAELEEKTRDMVSGQNSLDKIKGIHAEQCAELEKQIELVSLSHQYFKNVSGLCVC